MSDIVKYIDMRIAECIAQGHDHMALTLKAVQALRAELSGNEKALLAAKTVIEAKDRAYSVIDQRFAALSGKAATVDSERECNERLTAEIDELRAALAEAQRDAERYRWIRNRNNSLETRQYDLRVYNGPSCYHEVGGIRELKSESNLDAAIDAAILATKEGKKDERM